MSCCDVTDKSAIFTFIKTLSPVFMKRILVLITVLFLSIYWGFSQSTVWKIAGKGSEFFVAGSIHILRDQDYPLPEEFDEAYSNSDIVTTELDMQEMNNPENGMKMQKALMYQDEKTLSSVLSEDVYHKLDSVAKTLGVNIKMMDKFKPSMAIITLTFQSLQNLGVTSEGVDAHFTQKAQKDGKPMLFLETFDQQLAFIESMGKGNADEFVLYSIEDIKNNEAEFLRLIEQWKNGNQELMLEQLNEFRAQYPDVYKTLLLERNNSWMLQLEKYLETPEIEFVVVGAMHLMGPDGLLQQLEEKGYAVSQL